MCTVFRSIQKAYLMFLSLFCFYWRNGLQLQICTILIETWSSVWWYRIVFFSTLYQCRWSIALQKYLQLKKCNGFFFCHYTIFSCAIVYVAFLTSNAMHKIMQSKRNVRLTIDSFIFAINLKLEQFDKTFSCCVLTTYSTNIYWIENETPL